MTEHDVLVGFRLRLFTLADELGNVSAACRAMGVDRSTYYRVLMIGDEDGFNGVTRPRLHAAGADLSMVKDLHADGAAPLDIKKDAEALKDLLRDGDSQVVIFDQLLDNLGADEDRPHARRLLPGPAHRRLTPTRLVRRARAPRGHRGHRRCPRRGP